MSRTINQNGLNLVKHFEGLYQKAYLCPAKVWTIGYGHTKDVSEGDVITEKEAENLLCDDMQYSADAVTRIINVPLNDNQFAALVSFTFNCGEGALASSTLCKKLNNGDYASVPSELNRWVKAGGKTLQGLVKRRAAEGDLWLLETASQHPSQMPQQPDVVEDLPSFIVKAKSGLRMRSGPGLEFDVIDLIEYETELTIGKSAGDWVEVDLDRDGSIDGWVYKSFLKPR